jgi:hypothetical protein
MSITFVTRDYLNQIRSLFYQTKELVGKNNLNAGRDFLQSFLFFFEYHIPERFSSLFSLQWRKNLIHFPIIRPEVQIARTNSRIFSITPFFPRDFVPKKLDLLRFTDTRFPTTAFHRGFFNAFFLALPISLRFFISIRRYWLQGFSAGLRSTFGYRIGETILFRSISYGFRHLWWSIGSTLALGIGLFMTVFLLRESFSYSDSAYAFDKQAINSPYSARTNTYKSESNIFKKLREYQNLFYIFFLHLAYSWTEQITFFGTFRNQSFDAQIFSASCYSIERSISFSYLFGLFLGGLFYDLCFRIRILRRIEKVLLFWKCPPFEWKQIIHKWTIRFIIRFSFRSIPFYTADYLVFSGFGFFRS